MGDEFPLILNYTRMALDNSKPSHLDQIILFPFCFGRDFAQKPTCALRHELLYRKQRKC